MDEQSLRVLHEKDETAFEIEELDAEELELLRDLCEVYEEKAGT